MGAGNRRCLEALTGRIVLNFKWMVEHPTQYANIPAACSTTLWGFSRSEQSMTKSWVKVDAALPMHPKLEALAEYFDGMGVPEALAQHVAYSVVVRLFSLAYKHYADGNLGGMTKRALAYQLEWTGGAAQLHDGLVSTGFLDVTEDGLIVHGFAEWSGKTDSREMAAVRQQDKRARDKIKTLEAQVKQLIDGTEKGVMSRNVTQRHASDSYQTPIRSDQIKTRLLGVRRGRARARRRGGFYET